MEYRIAIIEDDKKIASLLKTYFQKEGFIVYEANDGLEGWKTIKDKKPDIAVLDLMLPIMDGFEVCKRVRQECDMPILMLTAKDEETDKLIGLEIGADDYVSKPFSPREVVARVKAILRRVKRPEGRAKTIVAGQLEIDTEKHTVRLGNSQLDLTPTEFKLLELLVANPERVYSRLQIVEHVQGYSFDGYERTVDAHIKNIRRKLGDASMVQTVYGVGYKFKPPED